MYNKEFKLIGTAVGLVAVLMMVLAVPGATQGSFSRQALVSALKSEIGPLLTAATAELINPENATFFSSNRATSAYIPPHPSAFSAQLFRDFMSGKAEGILMGAVYVSEDVPGSLNKGLYRIKALNREWVVVLNQEGEVVRRARIRWLVDDVEGIASNPSYWGKDNYIQLSVGSVDNIHRFNGGGGGGGGGTTQPPPPPPPPEPQPLSFKHTVSICTPTIIIVYCFTFMEVHI